MEINSGGISITIKSGALITVLLLLPNVVWMLLPKTAAGEPRPAPSLLTIAENMGRVAVLVLPFFFSLDLQKKYSAPVIGGMALALLVYYACWIRYFRGGQLVELFSAPFMGIPLPMAVAPTLFLVLSAYLMGSWWMLAASIWFGVAHIWVTALGL